MAEANQKQYYTVVLDLSLIEAAKFTSTEQFLQSFYHYIVQELPSVPPLKEWDRNTSAILNCTKDFQNLSVNFSSDGKTLAIAYIDGNLSFFPLTLDGLLSQGCGWLKDYLKFHPRVSEDLKSCQ